MKRIIIFIFSLIIISHSSHIIKAGNSDGKEINDPIFKFTLNLPDGWNTKDIKETADKDGISYSFTKKDTMCSIMLLAFKLTAVKNLDDFVYTIEKDATLNIPQKDGDYTVGDATYFDWKIANYNDVYTIEKIYYFRTKEPDAPNNFVYVLRFITDKIHNSDELQKQISKIADSFVPTPQ